MLARHSGQPWLGLLPRRTTRRAPALLLAPSRTPACLEQITVQPPSGTHPCGSLKIEKSLRAEPADCPPTNLGPLSCPLSTDEPPPRAHGQPDDVVQLHSQRRPRTAEPAADGMRRTTADARPRPAFRLSGALHAGCGHTRCARPLWSGTNLRHGGRGYTGIGIQRNDGSTARYGKL